MRLIAGGWPSEYRLMNGPVLWPGEEVHLDEYVVCERFHSVAATYQKAPLLRMLDPTTAGYVEHRRLARAQLEAAARWRGGAVRILATQFRIICCINGGYESIPHEAADELHLNAETSSVTVGYGAAVPPIRFVGERAIMFAVYLTWIFRGSDVIRDHPALAQLYADPSPS